MIRPHLRPKIYQFILFYWRPKEGEWKLTIVQPFQCVATTPENAIKQLKTHLPRRHQKYTGQYIERSYLKMLLSFILPNYHYGPDQRKAITFKR